MLDAICSRISHFSTIRSLGVSVAPWLLWLAVPLPIHAQNHTVAEIEARIAQLEQELSLARSELAEARQSQRGASGTDGIRVGPVSIGGAVRVNFVRGSYLDTGSGPARGGDGGNMELDTFRINAGLVRGPLIGQLEYRWYDGYNFLHTGWLGWAFEDESRVQVGVARVPFGPGPYGISKSWFYDQHYYVGLADDMDLGLAYHTRRGRWDLDIAYFTGSGGNWSGVSEDSTRYSYDVVRWRESVGQDGTVTYGESVNGYDEDGQLNARAIYRLGSALSPSSELGVSLQHGRIDGVGNDDGTHWAGSVHLISRAGGLELASQLTR